MPVAFTAAMRAPRRDCPWRGGWGWIFTVACMFCALNLLYSFLLKRIVLLDVVSISPRSCCAPLPGWKHCAM